MSSHNGACVLDLPPPSAGVRSISDTRRVSQRHLAQSIARQRLTRPNPRDQYQDGSNLVFRRNVLVEDDWEQYYPYLNVSFLNQHDTVLASDTYGRIDVIRLPRYCPPCQDGESTRPSRLLGEQLAGRLEFQHPVHSQGTFVKLKSLQGGLAFAAGMPSGHFRVFATEHASTWGGKHFGYSTKLTPDGPARMERTSSKKPQLIRHAWTVEGPRRRYPREYSVPKFSLRRMAQNGISKNMSLSMSEIPEWSTAGSEHYNHELKDKIDNCNMWDFRETPSAMLAAHVDRYRDCFSLRVMDDRIHQESNDAVMCIDMSTKEKFLNVQENITATCFSSGHCLATAHSLFMDNGIHSNSFIKWWDMRMLCGDRAEPAVESVVPSFPLNSAFCMEPCASFDPIDKSKFEKGADIPVYIQSLTPSAEGFGTLLVTLNSHLKAKPGVEHVLVDSTRPCAMQKVHTNRIPGSNPFAITPNHDFMASLSDKDENGSGRSVALYDLSLKSLLHQNMDRQEERRRKPVSRKRTSSNLLDGDQRVDSRFKGSIPVDITDRHGMRSGLSCMAFNDSGSALVAGSEDGDLFLWRGG